MPWRSARWSSSHEAWFAGLAYILDETDLPAGLRRRIAEAASPSGPSWTQPGFVSALSGILAGRRWSWVWLDDWRLRFERMGLWPRSWPEDLRSLPSRFGPTPRTLREGMALFTRAELKAWMAERGYPEPPPSRSAPAFLKAFSTAVPWHAFEPTAVERYRIRAGEVCERQARARVGLLADALVAVAGSARAAEDFEPSLGCHGWTLMLTGDCAAENAVATMMVDQIDPKDWRSWPPFFPGDRVRLRVLDSGEGRDGADRFARPPPSAPGTPVR